MKDIFKILRENGIEAHKGKQKDIRRLLNKNFIAIYLRRWYYILIHFWDSLLLFAIEYPKANNSTMNFQRTPFLYFTPYCLN